MTSGGVFGQCNGQLAVDFNAWRTANPTALGYPFAQGQTIRAQGWYRDPAAPSQTNLSDALLFTLCSGSGDTTPPVITSCAANQTVGTGANCQGVVPDFTASMVSSDTCSTVALTQSPAAGASAPLGANIVTITARDAAGNTAQCVATLTVTDTTGPVITTCAASQTVAANSNCQGVVPDFTTGVIASDSCGGAVMLDQSPSPGALVNLGITSVTVIAIDGAGNTSVCSLELVVPPSPTCALPPSVVPVQPGMFLMGESTLSSAQPVHQVSISYPFWFGAREVTRAEYAAVMGGAIPSEGSRPVEGVTWLQARAFCAALNAQQSAHIPAGYEYRLPTEAEWEYCCRAGTTSSFNVGNSFSCSFSNYRPSPSSFCVGQSTVVGSYVPNGWGMFDMHGNVMEWCLDSMGSYPSNPRTDPFVTGGSNRVARGGSWNDDPIDCRSAARRSAAPDGILPGIGFRVVIGPILMP
jgi:formylglycine-generating enzyme required for sulfatase activity